jgi:hypothetical protein
VYADAIAAHPVTSGLVALTVIALLYLALQRRFAKMEPDASWTKSLDRGASGAFATS